ncbi:NAD(P)H-dependent flavin oxidoreductase [Flavisphingomonas formosensis]|uniref:NAD(P)H-dependent flavin oxidoreductase n=1 Tax=Flavisphingomonas formosensis TaxID=861534 RepID=UPI0012FC07AC|nr:nitronate monooxygenase [Sphingomonas formosensis]
MAGSGGWRDRRLLDLFGLRVPIVQAPMAGSGGPDLAAEAIAGGALGSLPCALLTPERARADVGVVRQRASGPINLNFFCHRLPASNDDAAWRGVLAPYYAEYGVGAPAMPPPLRRPFSEEMCALVEEVRPEVVSFHFGLPDPALSDRVRASGARIIASATSLAEARILAERGCDAIIAQGWEAGGHAGRFLPADPAAQMGLFALLPQIADAVDVPVIAAGGIGDARGIAAALLLGASAVQIGTAYLKCPESLAGQAHRAALEGEGAERTVFTNLFSGGLARGIPNRLIEEVGPINAAAPPFPYASNALADLRRAAEAKGDMGFGPMWSGQAARLAPALPARELTEKLAAEALALLP